MVALEKMHGGWVMNIRMMYGLKGWINTVVATTRQNGTCSLLTSAKLSILLIYYMFFLRPPYFLYVPWCHTLNLCCTCAYYVYTMRNLCSLTSLLTLTPSRLFPILLDLKSFQTALDSVTWLPGHVSISYLSSVID